MAKFKNVDNEWVWLQYYALWSSETYDAMPHHDKQTDPIHYSKCSTWIPENIVPTTVHTCILLSNDRECYCFKCSTNDLYLEDDTFTWLKLTWEKIIVLLACNPSITAPVEVTCWRNVLSPPSNCSGNYKFPACVRFTLWEWVWVSPSEATTGTVFWKAHRWNWEYQKVIILLEDLCSRVAFKGVMYHIISRRQNRKWIH